MTKEAYKNRIAKWIKDAFKNAVIRENWKNLANKYDMFVNNSLIYYVRARLRNCLRIRDMMEKIKNQFVKV